MRFMTKAPFSPQGDANVVLTLLPLPGRIQSFSSTISQLHPSLHCNGVILLLTHSRETAPLDDLVTILCSHAIIWHAHTVMSVQLVLLKSVLQTLLCRGMQSWKKTLHFSSVNVHISDLWPDFHGDFRICAATDFSYTCEHWIYSTNVQLRAGCTATPSPWPQNKIKLKLTSFPYTLEKMLYFIKSVPKWLRFPSWIFTADVQNELKSEDLSYCKTVLLKTQEKALSTDQLGCFKRHNPKMQLTVRNAMSMHSMNL